MNQNPQPLYKITRITDTTLFLPGLGAVQAKRVEYQLPDKSLSYVQVPLQEFTAENVQNQIEQAVETWLGVMSISAPTFTPGAPPIYQVPG